VAGRGSEAAPALTLAERAYRALEERIVTLRLAPGAVLSEQTIARELGIGRSPVREALQRLAQEGLVVVLPRRGVLVSEINAATQSRLLEVRRDVERLLVRSACRAAGEAQCAEFRTLAEALERASKNGDAEGFMQLDARLNALLTEAADNEFIVKAIRLMSGLNRRFWYRFHGIADIGRCAKLHAALARAVGKRDVDGAARALDRLIDYIESFTRATVDAHRRG
jgi:DNA-binding GntR family transcriptional regulator